MSNISVDNAFFLDRLNNDREKFASETGSYIRERLRETSFARKILPPEYITRDECDRSVQHDQLTKIVDIEPNSRAMSINFRGSPDARYVNGRRYEIPFWVVSSEEFQKQEEELWAYQMPLLDLVEKNAISDIQAIEDEAFIGKVNTAIALSGKAASHSNTNDKWLTTNIPRGAFVQLFNTLANAGTVGTLGTHDFDAKRYQVDTVLMNEEDFNKMMLWAATTAGSGYASEVTINGYKYASIMGKKFIVTQKGELVPPRTMYAFSKKEYMGHSYILNDTKFWVDKRKNIITWCAYECIGMGIGNSYSMAKISSTETA